MANTNHQLINLMSDRAELVARLKELETQIENLIEDPSNPPLTATGRVITPDDAFYSNTRHPDGRATLGRTLKVTEIGWNHMRLSVTGSNDGTPKGTVVNLIW